LRVATEIFIERARSKKHASKRRPSVVEFLFELIYKSSWPDIIIMGDSNAVYA
jgi:hypothetical protein